MSLRVHLSSAYIGYRVGCMSQFNASARPFTSHNAHHSGMSGDRHASPLPSPSSHLNTGAAIYHPPSHPSPRGGVRDYPGGGPSYGNGPSFMGGGSSNNLVSANNGGWPTTAQPVMHSMPSPDMGGRTAGRRPPRSDSSNNMQMNNNDNGWPPSTRSGGSSPATFRPQVLGGGMAKRTVGPIDRSGNNTPVGPKRGPSGGFSGAMERERGAPPSSSMSGGIIGNGMMMSPTNGGYNNGGNGMMMAPGGGGPNRSHNSSPRPPQPRRNGSTDMTAVMTGRIPMDRNNSNNNINSNNNGMMMPQGGPPMISVTSSGSSNGNPNGPMGSPKAPLMTIATAGITLSKDATVDERHTFYMYEFRTKYCPMFTLYKCEEAKPYTCKQAHYENHLRRKPQMVDGRWTYSANLCVYPSLLDCPDGQSCRLSHRVQKEHIYHPAVYKTQFCESPLKSDGSGECAEYDEHCSKAHGETDLRLPLLDDTGIALRQMGGTASGHHRGASSSGSAHHSRSGSNVSDIIGDMVIHGDDDDNNDGGDHGGSKHHHNPDPYPRAVIPGGSNGIIISGPMPSYVSSSRDPSPRASPRLSNRPLTPASAVGLPPRGNNSINDMRGSLDGGHHRRGASNSGMIMSMSSGIGQASPRDHPQQLQPREIPSRGGIPNERDARDTREMIRNDRDPRDPREMVGISNGATSSLSQGRDPRDPREMRGSGAMHERPSNGGGSSDPRDPREQRGSGAAPILDRSSSLDSNASTNPDDSTGRIYSGGDGSRASGSSSTSGSISTPSLVASSRLQVTSAPFQPMSEAAGSSASSDGGAHPPDRQPTASLRDSPPVSPSPGTVGTSSSSTSGSGSTSRPTTAGSTLSPNSPSFTPSSMLTPTTLPPSGASATTTTSTSTTGGGGGIAAAVLGEHRATMDQEKPDHARYIYGFRVRTCSNFLDTTCSSDSYTCFDAHSRVPRRRKPQLQHGRFNYIPTRCRYVLEDKECPQNVHCRFAHGTEEVIYHPSKYKTQLCTHPLDKNGCCAGYGMHCAKAHGDDDRRIPVFETTDDSSGHVTLEDFYDFVCNEPEREAERKFYMYTYKTKKCEGFPWNCQCDGFDWHRPEERRRGPDIKYSPMACPNVKPYLNAEWGDPNIDCTGRRARVKPGKDGEMPIPDWDCEYAHTLLELMYHPQVYKTGLCDHFDEHDLSRWRCVWKRRCAHAHGKADLRSKEDAAEDWRRHTLAHTPATRARLLAAQQAHTQSPRVTPDTLAARQSPVGSVARLIPVPASMSSGSGNNSPHPAGTTTPGGSQGMMRTFAPRPSSGPGTANSSTTSSPMPFANTSGGMPATKPGATPRSGSPKQSGRSVSGGSYYGDGSQQQGPGNAWSPPPSPPLEAKQQKVGGQWMPLFDLSSSTWSAPMSPPAVPGTPNPLQTTGASTSSSMSGTSLPPGVTVTRVPVLPASQAGGIWRSDSEPSSKMGMSTGGSTSTSSRSSPPQTSTSLRLTIADETGAEWPPAASGQASAASLNVNQTQTAAGTIMYYKDNISAVGHDGLEVYKGTIKGVGVSVKLLYRLEFADFDARVHEVDKLLAITEAQELPLLTRYYQKAHVGSGTDEHVIVAQQDIIAPGETTLRDFFINHPPSTTSEDPVYIRWAQQLLLALQLLHRHGLSHGDLTPTTIFVSKDRSAIRLGDISRLRAAPKITAGTSEKEAKMADLLVRQRADMLAAGCLLYSMFTAGLTPFRKEHDRSSYAERLKLGPHPELDTSMLSASATHLVLNLLVPAEKRFNCEQALRHPMFWSAELNCKLLCCVSNRLLGTGGRNPNQRSSVSIDEMGRSIPSFLLQVDDDGRAAGTEAHANKGFCVELENFATSIFPVDPPMWAAHTHDTLLQAIQASGWATLNAPVISGDSAVSLVHFIVACIRFLVLSQQQSITATPPPHIICHVHELVRLPHIFPSCNQDRAAPTSMPTPSKLATFPPPLCHVSGGVDVALLCEGISRYFMPRFPSLTVTLQHLVQKHWRDDVTFAFLDTSLPPLLPYATFRGFVPSSSPPPQISSMPTPIGRPGSAAPSPHLAAAYRVGGPPPPHHMIRERDAHVAAQAQAVAAQQQHAMQLAQAAKNKATLAAAAEEAMTASLRKALTCPFGSEHDGGGGGGAHIISDPVMSACCGESFCRACVPIYLEFVAGSSSSKSGKLDTKLSPGTTAERNTPSPNAVKVIAAFAPGGGSSSPSLSSSSSSSATTPSSPSSDRERPIKETAASSSSSSSDSSDSKSSSGKSGASTPSSTPKKSPASSPTAASSTPSSTTATVVTNTTPIISAAVAPLTPMAALVITDDTKSNARPSSKPIGSCGCGYVLTDDDRTKLPSAPRNQALASIMHALILAKKVGPITNRV